MITYLPSFAEGLWRRGRGLTGTSFAVALCAAAFTAAGCGSSSKSSSSATSTASSTPATSSNPSSSSQPLTKAQYEQKLGPLLNDVVDPALRAALGNGGATNPRKLSQAITSLQLSHDQMAAVTPPAEVAGVHKHAVFVLASLIKDATSLHDAEIRSNGAQELSALNRLKTEAQQLQNIGSQFTARGY